MTTYLPGGALREQLGASPLGVRAVAPSCVRSLRPHYSRVYHSHRVSARHSLLHPHAFAAYFPSRRRVQMDWLSYATYSKYHPDNFNKPGHKLPEVVKAPAPIVALDETDKKVFGGWGHTLCCEKAFGPSETRTRIKEAVAPKVGATWRGTVGFERGESTSNSAMYGGSWREMSFEEMVELKGKKG